MQHALFIPDRLTDHRMWAGIPDRLARRADVSHLDQLITLPWTAEPAAVVPLARSLSPGGWDVVIGAGRAAALVVALAAATLARGLALVEPPIPFDRIPEDVDLPWTRDTETLPSYERLISELHDAMPQEWQELLVQTIRQTTAPDVPADELELAVRIAADHAAEARAELLAFETAEAAGRHGPDDAEWKRQRDRGGWLDQLATLTVPVVIIVPPLGAVRRADGRQDRRRHTDGRHRAWHRATQHAGRTGSGSRGDRTPA